MKAENNTQLATVGKMMSHASARLSLLLKVVIVLTIYFVSRRVLGSMWSEELRSLVIDETLESILEIAYRYGLLEHYICTDLLGGPGGVLRRHVFVTCPHV
jgi:hypothetical protein